MKKLLIGIIVIAVIFGGFFITRNVLIKAVIIKGVRATTGMDVDIQNIDLAAQSILISGLKVYNPAGFKDRLMADIPEVFVDLDLAGLFKSQVHLRQVKINVSELDVILNENGKMNLNSLALLAPKPTGAKPQASGAKPPAVKIDELLLTIGKVAYKGYLPALGVQSKELNIGLNETFRDVTNPSSIAADILKRVVNRIGVSGISDKLQTQQVVGETMQKAKDSLKGLFTK